MLSASSPIRFPESSSPPPPVKRPNPSVQLPTKARSRTAGPFILEEDDEEDAQVPGGPNDDNDHAMGREDYPSGPSPKRRMIHDPRDIAPIPEAISKASEPAQDADTTLDATLAGKTTEASQPALPSWAPNRPVFSSSVLDAMSPSSYKITTCRGKSTAVQQREAAQAVSYETMVAARSKTKEGRAKRSYYGIEVHELVDKAKKELAEKTAAPQVDQDKPLPTVEIPALGKKTKKALLWTEKYRARNFMDLCGDDGTNRLVLRWLKKWDPVVFPGRVKSRPVINRRPAKEGTEEEKPHKKILMLTGPPGLGKTTLAHVCARQAGYEVMEVNASDDRSRDVVKNRIRTSLGTESVKTVSNRKSEDGPQKAAKPACVVVDEVDGVVSGSGGSGEGGFIKALIDLVLTDQKNASAAGTTANYGRKKKGDDFRLMRPLILICNDVYHPSLRPLRQSNLAEIVHIGRPQMDAVVGRLKSVFEKEGIPCEKDAARKLCEAAWGMSSGIDAKRGAESTVEGDLRGVMVVGEWVAGRFRAASLAGNASLTKQWIERNVLHDLTSGASGSRGLGRGNVKDIVSRLFQEGGGFPKQALDLSESKTTHEQPKTELGLGEQRKKHAMQRLREMIDTSGEISHIVTEIFAEYPNRDYNDDLYLTKPNEAYEWLHFHDECQSRLYANQEWELAAYLSQPVLAWHHLFASPKRHYVAPPAYEKRWVADSTDEEAAPLPFSGARGDYQAFEAEKQNRAQLQSMQSQLNPTMMRLFRSAEDMATDFLPYLVRLVSPDVKPVVVGGSQGSTASVRKDSERQMVKRAAEVLAEVGVAVVKGKIESDSPGTNAQFVYRLEPDLDTLATFETAATLFLPSSAPTRYAVRQVLDQELQRTIAQREAHARQARFQAGGGGVAPTSTLPIAPIRSLSGQENRGLDKPAVAIKRDFFGRVVEVKPLAELDANALAARREREKKDGPGGKVWVTYHEGLNNAVRKPLSLQEFLGSL
ncbi:ATPase family associated with various cellular activities (AAA) domain-containing protein [Sarocladium implicatum]|nr:ATPase family associated with various cellular activities (AAA) domain-containing protein [Sarocladium implicatum]